MPAQDPGSCIAEVGPHAYLAHTLWDRQDCQRPPAMIFQDQPSYIALYFLIGIASCILGIRAMRRKENGIEPLFVAFGLIVLFWALVWAFGIHKLVGI